MNAHPATGNGVLLLDGARHENATAWLYQRFPAHQPWPLLLGTDYEPIADAGPILLEAPQGSPVYEAWRHGSDIEDGVWLQSDAALDDLQRILQRRLRIFTPERGELWLRLGDARPLYRALAERGAVAGRFLAWRPGRLASRWDRHFLRLA